MHVFKKKFKNLNQCFLIADFFKSALFRADIRDHDTASIFVAQGEGYAKAYKEGLLLGIEIGALQQKLEDITSAAQKK